MFCCDLLYVESQFAAPAIYITPIVTFRPSRTTLNNQKKEQKNVETITNQAPVYYVTPTNLEKENPRAVQKRKTRGSPPSTSYGVPLLPQALPAVQLSTSFASNAEEEEAQKYQELTQQYSPRKMDSTNLKPPSTSYGVPLLSESQSGTSFESKSSEESKSSSSESQEEKGYHYPKLANEETIINKNVYFYKAPSEFEVPLPIKPIKLPKPQKNYKVIFIKAPSVPAPPQIIQLPPQTQDKTLVYVLVKKPEEQPDLVIPTPTPTQPSKPEVYFVKYGTQTERVETAEKTYGVPQYSKGYYYGGENDEAERKSDETESTTNAGKERSTKSKREEKGQNCKPVALKKNRGSSRGVRSSSLSHEIVRNDLEESNIYVTSLKQRSKVYE